MNANQRLAHEMSCLKTELDRAKAVLEQIPKCPIHGEGCRDYQLQWIIEKKLNKPAEKLPFSRRIINFFSNI